MPFLLLILQILEESEIWPFQFFVEIWTLATFIASWLNIFKFCYFVSFYCLSKKLAVVKELLRLHSSVDLKHGIEIMVNNAYMHACSAASVMHRSLQPHGL